MDVVDLFGDFDEGQLLESQQAALACAHAVLRVVAARQDHEPRPASAA